MNAVSVSVWMFCKYIKYNRMDGPFDSGTRRLYYSIWFRLDVFAGLILVDRIHEKCATNFINSNVYVLRSEKREFRNWHVRLFSTVNAMAKKKRVREMKSNRLAIGWVQSICLIVLAWLVSHLHKRRWCGSNIQWHVLHTHTHTQTDSQIHSFHNGFSRSLGWRLLQTGYNDNRQGNDIFYSINAYTILSVGVKLPSVFSCATSLCTVHSVPSWARDDGVPRARHTPSAKRCVWMLLSIKFQLKW